MQPLECVFMIPENCELDGRLMDEMLSRGHSRIPVFCNDDPSNLPVIFGKLYQKKYGHQRR
jgi:CBS domain containing-hemolysin-like protein